MTEDSVSLFRLWFWRLMAVFVAVGVVLIAVQVDFGPGRWSVIGQLPKDTVVTQAFRYNTTSPNWAPWQWEHFFKREAISVDALFRELSPGLVGSYLVDSDARQGVLSLQLRYRQERADLLARFEKVTKAYLAEHARQEAAAAPGEEPIDPEQPPSEALPGGMAPLPGEAPPAIGKVHDRRGSLAQQVAALKEEFEQGLSGEDREMSRAIQIERDIENWINTKEQQRTVRQWQINKSQKEYAQLTSALAAERQRLSLSRSPHESDEILGRIKTIERKKQTLQMEIRQQFLTIESLGKEVEFVESFLPARRTGSEPEEGDSPPGQPASLPAGVASSDAPGNTDDQTAWPQPSKDDSPNSIAQNAEVTRPDRTVQRPLVPGAAVPVLVKPVSSIVLKTRLNWRGSLLLGLLIFLSGLIGFLLCPVRGPRRNAMSRSDAIEKKVPNAPNDVIEPNAPQGVDAGRHTPLQGEKESLIAMSRSESGEKEEPALKSWDPHYDELAQKVIDLYKAGDADTSRSPSLMVVISALDHENISPRAAVDLAISLTRRKLQVLLVETERNCHDLTAIFAPEAMASDPESQRLSDFTHWIEQKVDLSEVVIDTPLSNLYFIPGGTVTAGVPEEAAMADSLLSCTDSAQREAVIARLDSLRVFFDVVLFYSPSALPALTHPPAASDCPVVRWLPDIADGLITQMFSTRKSRQTGRKTGLRIASLLENTKTHYLGLSYWGD
ncbi:MAG: hypothetical protein K9M57_05580 [Phycisphaerae bacterium]|nr:hypothetical protein [Phycisphaerae bacterium]